jgi:hypothetical protein
VLQHLANIDRALFYWINRDHRAAWLDAAMPFLSGEGKFKPFFLVIFVLLLIFGKAKGRAAALLVIPLLVISDQSASNFIKHGFDRLRPCNVLPDVHLQVGCGVVLDAQLAPRTPRRRGASSSSILGCGYRSGCSPSGSAIRASMSACIGRPTCSSASWLESLRR